MIYLVRHGEAAAHWGEHPNPGLSETGAAQAEAVAQTLVQNGSIRQAFTSPMQRCVETAAPFAKVSGLSAPVATEITEIPTPADIADRRAWLSTLMAGTWDQAPALVTDWRAGPLRRRSANTRRRIQSPNAWSLSCFSHTGGAGRPLRRLSR